MTDSLTPGDLQRIEAVVMLDKPKDKDSLRKAIDKNKYFPKTLKDFLKKNFGKNLPEQTERKQAESYALGKGWKIPDAFKVTTFGWKHSTWKEAVKAVSIRDEKGRFKGWFRFKE